MVVEQLERPELEGAGPVDVAIPVVTPKQGPAQLRVAEDFTGLGPVVAAADVHVDDAGAPQEPEVVDVELRSDDADRRIREPVSFLFVEIDPGGPTGPRRRARVHAHVARTGLPEIVP